MSDEIESTAVDEEKQDRTSTAAEKKRKPIPVTVVEQRGKSALVEWLDGDLPVRTYVPAGEVLLEKVDRMVLDAGIPYGEAWDAAVTLPKITPRALCAALRRAGYWTIADLEANPKNFQRVLHDLTGLTIGSLRQAAKKLKEDTHE